MKIRPLLPYVFFFAALAGTREAEAKGTVGQPITDAQGRPMNILILYNDDMGWGDLGVQGHPFAKTPAIDRLAATGTRFTQFYVTAPICSPSRAGLMTGRIQNRFGMKKLINDSLDPKEGFHHVPVDEPMMPRLLQTAGYRTLHIGKWHISFPKRQGEPNLQDYGYDHTMLIGAGRHTSYWNSSWDRDGVRVKTEGRWSAEVYVDEAIKFIEENPGRPFFINLWSFAPHQEVVCAPEFRQMYADRSEQEQYYYGTISQMDEQYGRLLDYLDRHGLADRTIVVFSSDNGPEPHLIPWSDRARGSTGGLRGGKHHLYDGGIRVPGIIRWPGVTKPGTVSREIAWTADLLPTFAAAIGIRPFPDRPLDGIDLRPALAGGKLDRPQPLYWEFEGGVGLRDGVKAEVPGLALREGRWKFHCDFKFENVALYDMDIDLNEKWNMKDFHPEVAARLLAKMRALHAEVNGPYSRSANFWNPKMIHEPKIIGEPKSHPK
jgi:arylsulfatase A